MISGRGLLLRALDQARQERHAGLALDRVEQRRHHHAEVRDGPGHVRGTAASAPCAASAPRGVPDRDVGLQSVDRLGAVLGQLLVEPALQRQPGQVVGDVAAKGLGGKVGRDVSVNSNARA